MCMWFTLATYVNVPTHLSVSGKDNDNSIEKMLSSRELPCFRTANLLYLQKDSRAKPVTIFFLHVGRQTWIYTFKRTERLSQ